VAEVLQTIPDVLCHVGNELANHGESLLALQQQCHREADGVQLGWVGSSADALSWLLERWGIVSVAHMGRFGEHSCGMQWAAAAFTEMERCNAAALAGVYASGSQSQSAQ
jgi:hypothetical protein